MTAKREQLSALRRSLAKIEAAGTQAVCRKNQDGRLVLDRGPIDSAVGGGLERGALHEIVAERAANAVAARGFAAALALRAGCDRAGRGTIVWATQEQTLREIGQLAADGLNAIGLDPAALLLVRARDAAAALRATVEAARCTAIAAVVGEIWGTPKALDLNATRRLMLAAQQSGVTVILARLGAAAEPSAAETRWSVSAAPSMALAANAPGFPAFSLNLLRHRHGVPAGPWHVEWNSDDHLFSHTDAAHTSHQDTAGAGDRLPAFFDGPAAARAAGRVLRLAG